MAISFFKLRMPFPFKKAIILLSCLFVSISPAFAAHELGSSRLNFSSYNASTNNSIFLEDNKFATISSNLATPANFGFFDLSYKNKLVFGIDRSVLSLGAISANLTNNVYRAEVDVTIIYNQLAPQGGGYVLNMLNVGKTFTVSFSGFNNQVSSSGPTTEIDLDAFNLSNSYQCLVTISAVRIYNSYVSTTPIAGTNVPANLYLELQYDAERYYDLNTSAAAPYTSNSALTVNYLSGTSTGNEFEVKWLRIPGAEEYELEWLWLDEGTYGGTSGGPTPIAIPASPYWNASTREISFKNNATRIRTDQNSYRISNIYETGYLLFRIRAVGRAKTPAALIALGNSALSESYTNWTWPDTYTPPAGAPTTPAGVTGVASSIWPFYASLTGIPHEQNKNWVFTASFAEEGKKSEVVSYFDGSQRNRQTVTKNNSDNIAVVGETYYDYLGRPTIQALPTPVADATIKFYQQTTPGNKTSFNFDINGNAFTKDVFAAAASAGQCALTAPGFTNAYGTGMYYSANNTFTSLTYNNGYIPQGENYPFTQTEYTPDKTGKIARQSGVGASLKMENGVGVPKHDTRYLYGSVTQDELDRLFGSEAGYSTHYTKNMVIDPNGQVSVSYLNQAGKTVATALSGGKPANLQPLLAADGSTDLSNIPANTMQSDLLNKASASSVDAPEDNNLRVNDQLVYSEKILVSTPQNYQFDYSLQGSSFNGCSYGGIIHAYDCAYDIEFDIRDKCNQRPAGFNGITYSLGKITPPYPGSASSTNFDSQSGNDLVNFSFSQIFPSGAYPLSVFLDIGEYTVTKRLKVNQAALQVYLADYLKYCADGPTKFDTDEQVNYNASGCEMDCQECAAALGTEAQFITNNPSLTLQQAKDQYRLLLQNCYEPCGYESYCETTADAMMIDMSPSGQYAEYGYSSGTFNASAYPLSIFNSVNSLPQRALSAPPTWRSPKHYLTGATSYLDEFGQPDKVSVFQTYPGSLVFVPPIQASAPLTAGPNPNEFYVAPEKLLNEADFIAAFKPSWAQSLLVYHPEYPYIEWCLKNATQQVSTAVPFKYNKYDYTNPNNPTINSIITGYVKTSDDFDSLYTAIDDIDDIDNTSFLPAPFGSIKSYDVIFNPFTYDPYWTTTAYYYIAGISPNISGVNYPNPAENASPANGSLIPQLPAGYSGANPADFTSVAIYPKHKKDKTANNRFYNYKNTGLNLYQFAAMVSTPLGMQYGQSMNTLLSSLNSTYYSSIPANGQAYIMNIIDPANPASDAFKRKAWSTYKTLYLALKCELQEEAAQSYVMNSVTRGCNDCIGKTNFELRSVKYTTYPVDIMGQVLVACLAPGGPINVSSYVNLSNFLWLSIQKTWFHPYNTTISPYNKDQYCGLATKDLYQNKIKRFYKTDDALELAPNGVNNSQAAIYAQTGLCPNAYDLQSFLNGMLNTDNISVNTGNAYNSFFNTGVSGAGFDLSQYVPEFSQNLYQVIAPTIPSPAAKFKYDVSTSTTQNLVANISIGSSNCAFNLQLPAIDPNLPSGLFSWISYQSSSPLYKINQFVSMQATSNTQFNVTAIISSTGVNPQIYSLILSGNSCISLTGCGFSAPCEPNGNGKAINALLNTFAAASTFPSPYNGTSYISGNILTPAPTPYSYVFINSIKPLLETSSISNNWTWSYSSNQILIQDATPSNTNKQLQIAFTLPFAFVPAPGGSNTTPNISCIKGFQNFQPDPSIPGGFTAEGITDNLSPCEAGTVIVKGVVNLGGVPLKLGICSFELTTCKTQEHQVSRDVEAWATTTGSGFNTMLASGSAINISSNAFFTSLLRSYLNSATTYNTNGPIQNYFYWLPDAIYNANNDKKAGWIVVNQSQTAPSNAPSGSCYITVEKITSGGINTISTLLNAGPLSIYSVASGLFINTNFYSFKVFPNGGGQYDTLLVTSTCFPLKACKSCTSTTQQVVTVLNTIQYPIEDFKSTLPMYFLSTPPINSYNFIPALNPGPNYAITNGESFHSPVSGISFNQLSPCPLPPMLITGSGLAFNPNSPSPNLNGATTIFQKNFYAPFDGSFNIQLPLINGDDFGGQPVATYYINNVAIGTFNILPAGSAITSSGGNYFLTANSLNTFKIIITHGNTSSCRRVYTMAPIYMTEASSQIFKIPCTNTPWPTDTMPTVQYEEPCAPYLQDIVDNTADEKYDAYLADKKATFIRDYTNYCLNTAVETLKMKYNNTDYHFTLYYYDQAGNLVRTVPPQGVKPINLTAIYTGAQTNREAIIDDRKNYTTVTKKIYTKHNFLTTYTYNSLNQLVKQETPDAGISKFYYDNLGRLVASQNAQQKFQSSGSDQKYSYTRYDALGRVAMVGQLGTNDLDTYPLSGGQTLRDLLSASNYPLNLAIAANSHVDVTQTYYGDDPAFVAIAPSAWFSNGMQQNLRGRVATMSIEDAYDGNNATYQHATHYTYDIHGNVKELLQENPDLTRFTYYFSQQYKRIEYDYDLISGKVNTVTYQRGQPDMFAHSYWYDAANRLTNVYTTRDGVTWDQDAKYYYYPHGPLARTELGEHKVQGNDYAYTLQGWIKGVNNEKLAANNDMGLDGSLSSSTNKHKYTGRDAYAYSLNYYGDVSTSTRDYLPVNSSHTAAATYFLGTQITTSALSPLYNGNISSMSACYLSPDPGTIPVTGLSGALNIVKNSSYCFMRHFAYDQLNRVRSSRTTAKAVDNNNNWLYTVAGSLANEFAEDFKFDQNGNLTKVDRRLAAGSFDNQVYYYYDAAGTPFNPMTTSVAAPTNKLAYVTDVDAAGNQSADIDNQSTTTNYVYDKNGNLTADASENISSITWNVYGKIKNISRNTTSKPGLTFKYDAAGNRVSKKSANNALTSLTTYYVRDAQGNIMATYVDQMSGSGAANVLTIGELNVYGSTRLGTKNVNKVMGYLNNGVSQVYPSGMLALPETGRTLGYKSYELSNHLGNVLAVIGDRKLPADNNADNVIDNFWADVLSGTDYYAFGAPMPGRQYNSNGYRYGFNGKENDNEVKGTGAQQDYGMRIYDPRLGKFLSVDPLTKEYPWNSVYAFAENDVIRSKDLDGAEKDIVTIYLDQSGAQIGNPTFETLPKPGPLGDGTLTKFEQLKWYGSESSKASYFAPQGQQYIPSIDVSPSLWQNIKFKTSKFTDQISRSTKGSMKNYGALEGDNGRKKVSDLVHSINDLGEQIPIIGEAFALNDALWTGMDVAADIEKGNIKTAAVRLVTEVAGNLIDDAIDKGVSAKPLTKGAVNVTTKIITGYVSNEIVDEVEKQEIEEKRK